MPAHVRALIIICARLDPGILSLLFYAVIVPLQAASSQEQEPQSHALSCLLKCPPDVLPIFKRVLRIMNLSDKDLSPTPTRTLSGEETRHKVLFTGMFPGTSHLSLGHPR